MQKYEYISEHAGGFKGWSRLIVFNFIYFFFLLLEKIFASIIIGHNPDGEAYLITPATSVRAGTEPPMVPVTDLSSIKS